MAKSGASKNISEAMTSLVERARNDSIGSIDHTVNAKAIALGSKEVQAAVQELLDRDFQLIAIQPLRGFGSSLMSFPLHFVFRPGGDAGPVSLNEFFVVLVELPMRSVKRISKSSEMEAVGDVPFAIAANARFQAPITQRSELAPRYQREASFYQDIGMGGWGMGGGMGGWGGAASGTDETATVSRHYDDTGSASGSDTYSDGKADDSSDDDSTVDDKEEHLTWVNDHGDDDAGRGYVPGDWEGPTVPGGGRPGRPGSPGGGWPWPDPPRPYGRYRRY